jgi:hypothetical protein
VSLAYTYRQPSPSVSRHSIRRYSSAYRHASTESQLHAATTPIACRTAGAAGA